MEVKNLVFSGSGTLLPAFSGAIKAFFRHNGKEDIKRVCGTSGGSIYAYLLIVNRFDVIEVERVIKEMDFGKFFDNSFGWFRDMWRLIRYGGWNKGEEIIKFLQDQLLKSINRDDITFLEFFGKYGIDFTVVTTNLSWGKAVYCNAENTPNLSVIEAIRRSMSIPFFFMPRIDDIGDVYVDGGLVNNMAIKLYDWMGKPEETIGIRLYETPKKTHITGFLGILRGCRRTLIGSHYEDDTTGLSRTVSVFDCGLDGTNPLDALEKQALIRAGVGAMQKWINEQ
jgi:NTE family protein